MQASFSVHAGGCNAHSTNGDYFFETWDTQMLNASYKLTQCCDENSTKCLDNLVSHTLLPRHLWVAAGQTNKCLSGGRANRRTTAVPSPRW